MYVIGFFEEYHGLQNTDVTDHGFTENDTNHGRGIHGKTDLDQLDFLIFSSNQMNGYHQVNVFQSGQRDHRQMYIDMYEFFITD